MVLTLFWSWKLTCHSALIDGRVGWTILKGQQIAIGYASEAEICHWGKMKLGESEILKQKVDELNSRGIKTNFIFVKASKNGS